MIDRAALEEVAGRLLEAMQAPSGLSLIVHLLVYPADDELKDEVPRDARGAGIFDRLVLPYQAISYVTITAREPESRSTIGFHTKPIQT